jgi:hypothetical protein
MPVTQVAVKAIARRETVAAGLAVVASCVPAVGRAPRVMASRQVTPRVPAMRRSMGEVALPAVAAVPVTRVPLVAIALLFHAPLVAPAALVVTTGLVRLPAGVAHFFGVPPAIAAIRVRSRGKRQQQRGEPRQCHCEKRPVVVDHAGPPVVRSDVFDAHAPGKFTQGSRLQEKRREIAEVIEAAAHLSDDAGRW